MDLKSSENYYGVVAVTIHWLSAVLIFVLLGSGFSAGQSEDPIDKVFFLRFHVPIGVTVLLLTIARILWWFLADTKPKPVPMPTWQDRALLLGLLAGALLLLALGLA